MVSVKIKPHQIEATKKKAAEYLYRDSADEDQSLSAKQRLHVWFRNGQGDITLYDPHHYVKIDQTGDTSEFDIGRDK